VLGRPADAQSPIAVQSAGFEVPPEFIARFDDRFGVVDDELSESGEPDAPLVALEQRAAEGRLQPPDLTAQRGLRQPELVGRAIEAADSGDGAEVPKVMQLQFHGVTLSGSSARGDQPRFYDLSAEGRETATKKGEIPPAPSRAQRISAGMRPRHTALALPADIRAKLTSIRSPDRAVDAPERDRPTVGNAMVNVDPLTAECARVFPDADGVCIGVSPFNSYFSAERLLGLASWGLNNFRTCHFFIPDEAAAYTLEALGYAPRRARQNAWRQGRYVSTRCDMPWRRSTSPNRRTSCSTCEGCTSTSATRTC
jgi:hypothetical protein